MDEEQGVWHDTTGYSRGKKREPNTFTMHVGQFQLTVSCNVRGYDDGTWVADERYLFDWRRLQATNEQDAKAEAVKLLRGRLYEALGALDGMGVGVER